MWLGRVYTDSVFCVGKRHVVWFSFPLLWISGIWFQKVFALFPELQSKNQTSCGPGNFPDESPWWRALAMEHTCQMQMFKLFQANGTQIVSNYLEFYDSFLSSPILYLPKSQESPWRVMYYHTFKSYLFTFYLLSNEKIIESGFFYCHKLVFKTFHSTGRILETVQEGVHLNKISSHLSNMIPYSHVLYPSRLSLTKQKRKGKSERLRKSLLTDSQLNLIPVEWTGKIDSLKAILKFVPSLWCSTSAMLCPSL